ncbi:hypothetical protein [Amycolatopsis rifamycinica]|uniref:hypothetical protein n=1 Tax=Amycolatopsis rifamycinica TaxID=287986 RepID=UPI0012699847|nr:hypothetical protein [Amycolatopsis rifamycinica]
MVVGNDHRPGAARPRTPPAAGAALPRLWWIPTGLLGMLPLHAAGQPGGPSALHRVTREPRDEYPDAPRLWAPFVHSGP